MRASSGAERAELLIELATVEYRAGQLAASLQHAVAAADAAEREGGSTWWLTRRWWCAASGIRRSP